MRALLVAVVLALSTSVPVFADDSDGYAPTPTTVQSGDVTTLLP
jgi:hypothetical protein